MGQGNGIRPLRKAPLIHLGIAAAALALGIAVGVWVSGEESPAASTEAAIATSTSPTACENLAALAQRVAEGAAMDDQYVLATAFEPGESQPRDTMQHLLDRCLGAQVP